MAVPIVGFPILTAMVRGIGVVVSVLVLIWAFHFRGGLSLSSNNKDLIFNVHPLLLVISLILLNDEDFRTLSSALSVTRVLLPAKQNKARALVENFDAKVRAQFILQEIYMTIIGFKSGKMGCWFFNLLVSRWLNEQQSCSASLPCIFWDIHICTCSWHCCYRNSGENYILANHVISHYSTEAVVVNFMGILIVVLGGCVILAVVASMNDKEDGYRPLDYELQLSTV